MQRWSQTAIGSWLVPGGILLLTAALLANIPVLTLPIPALSFLYYCAVLGGMLLAWRFHSGRIFFALLVLALAGKALETFVHELAPGMLGHTGLEAVAVLVCLDFFLIAMVQERGLTRSSMAPLGLLLFVQVAVLAVLSQSTSAVHSPRTHHLSSVSFPDFVWFTFLAVGIVLLVRALLIHKPADSALFWSLACFFLSLRNVESIRTSSMYAIASAMILATAVVENSYLLAYHDELTTLPSRRAFNDALLRLPETYSIAAVDIDHFKRFNDTYGHDIGDQVLRLVATNLSRVAGGGAAYRCGGEEFIILFPGKAANEVLEHLEELRKKIESAEFHMRGKDRRHLPRGPERRNPPTGRATSKGHAIRRLASSGSPDRLSVTVSMGVSTCKEGKSKPEQILKAADQALYRAKANGRNRVEVSRSGERSSAKAAGIA